MLYFISKDVQEYMEQNHLESTDFEKAALIYNAGLPVLERLELDSFVLFLNKYQKQLQELSPSANM